MKEIPISEFRSRCNAILAEVQRTGESIRITRFGNPLADVHPASGPAHSPRRFGAMRGTARIVGDIVSPAVDESEWEVLRN
jgi:prevent-host-death family protein